MFVEGPVPHLRTKPSLVKGVFERCVVPTRLGVTYNSDLLAVNATLHRAFNRKIIQENHSMPDWVERGYQARAAKGESE